MENPKISVIVPVYKVEKYLCRCIESVLNQTYTNIEVILVNDGSPDNCPEICDAYAQKDERIKVIHKTNGGLSSARNAGLDIASGDYIGFVDSDDYIAPNMYERLYKLIKDKNAQMAVCNCFFVDEFDNYLFRYSPLNEETVSGIEALEFLQKKNGINYVTCWNKLYERNLFLDTRFPLNKICEDNYIAHILYHKCEKVSFTKEKLYYYVQRKGSILNSSISIKSFDETEGYYRRIEYLNSNNINYNPQAHFNQFLDSYTHFKLFFYPHTKSEKTRIKEINKMAISVYKQAFKQCSKKKAVITVLPFGVIHLLLKLIKVLIILCLNVRQMFCHYVLINLPRYDNLGDQAIALSEIQLFKRKGIPTIKIEEMITHLFPDLLNHIKKDKTIIVSGGGFVGNLWPENEAKYVSGVIERFKENKIIIFPQSVTFDLTNDSGKRYFDYISTIYKSHNNLELFVRERKSFEFVKDNIPELSVHLVPDIVLIYEADMSQRHREGILFCLRSDHECSLDYSDEIQKEVKMIYPNYQMNYADNLLGRNILPFFRKKEVNNQLHIFSSAKLVVTDRLHGMIFAAITNTPCIALDNSNGKVSGVYEWIKKNEFIRFCSTVDDVKNALETLDIDKSYLFNKAAIERAMKPLVEEIKNA